MNFSAGKFVIGRQDTLVLVAYQVWLSKPVEDAELDADVVKGFASELGFSKYMPYKQGVVSPGQPTPPEINTVERFLNNELNCGFAVAKESISLFTSKYEGFDQLASIYKSILHGVCSSCGTDESFHSLGVRYLNRFPLNDSGPLAAGISGFRPSGILEQFEHQHPSSDFWCQTEKGRLHVRSALNHGSTSPENMGYADVVFDNSLLRSFDEMVTHLDIFESLTDKEGMTTDEVFEELGSARLRISQAFLDSISDEQIVYLGMKQK